MMKIYTNIDSIPNMETPLSIALGTFDGIHLGHMRILEDAVSEAGLRHIKSACYTFSNIPRDYLHHLQHPDAAPLRRLCSPDEKMRLLEQIGLDYVFNIPFDETIMRMRSDFFVKHFLAERLHVRVICCGFNYSYGARAEGTVGTLRKQAAECGIAVRAHDAVYVDGQIVSSSAIRDALQNQEWEKAERMLGRPYTDVLQGG